MRRDWIARLLLPCLLLAGTGFAGHPVAGPATPAGQPPPAAAAGPVGHLRLITPLRVVDTRSTFGGPIGFTPAGTPITAGPLPANAVTRFRIGGMTFGSTTVPSDTTGLLLNVTIQQGGPSGGFVTVFPGDVPDAQRPNASTVNPTSAIAANFWSVGLPTTGGNAGTIAVYTTNVLEVIVDVVGYFSPSNPATIGNLAFITPVRVLDTRPGSTVGFQPNGQPITAGPVPATTPTRFLVSGRTFAGFTFPGDVSGLLAHVTIQQGGPSGGFVTLYPGDAPSVPNASTVNPANPIAFNSWAMGIPTTGAHGGTFQVYSTNTLDVIVDVVGYYAASNPATVGELTFLKPVRTVDTRSTDGGPIGFDPFGTPIPAGAFTPETVRRYLLSGQSFPGGVLPVGLTGIFANVTVVQPAASGGFVTAFPGQVPDAQRPNVSTVNPVTAIAASWWANGLPTVSPNAGTEAIYSTHDVHVIVDVLGYFVRPSGPSPTVVPTSTSPAAPTATRTPTAAAPTATPPTGGTNPPTLVSQYSFWDVNSAPPQASTRYRPRQFVSGLVITDYTWGDQPVQDAGAYQGWDLLLIANEGLQRVQQVPNYLTVRLTRPATLAVVWRSPYAPPAWLASWTRAGDVRANGWTLPVYRRSVGAGDTVLGAVYDSSGPQGECCGRDVYWLLVAESTGQPSPAPSVPAGREVPQPNQTCPSWVHDQYTTVGPDGVSYPTWHPQIDPVYWCYFRHEHGSDPSLAHPTYKPPYGYVTARAGAAEPHPGFKSYVLDDGQGQRWLLSHHFGTGSLNRACARFHALDLVVVAQASQTILAELHLMADFGKAVSNTTGEALVPPACPNQAAEAEATGSTGQRKLPVQTLGAVGYEPWQMDARGTVLGLQGAFSINTPDGVVICYDLGCSTAVTTGSTGSFRFLTYTAGTGVRAQGAASGTFYTDGQGRTLLSAGQAGSVRQYLQPGLALTLPTLASNAECYAQEPWRSFYTCGPDPLTGQPTNREGSLQGPN